MRAGHRAKRGHENIEYGGGRECVAEEGDAIIAGRQLDREDARADDSCRKQAGAKQFSEQAAGEFVRHLEAA